MDSSSLLEELLDLISAALGGVGRLAASLVLGLLALAAAGSLLFFVHDVGSPSIVAPWLLLCWFGYEQVRAVRGAREQLRAVVAGAVPAEGPAGSALLSGRVASLRHLARAFDHARRGDSISSEMALARVERTDLGPWEARVLEAVRAMACLDRSDTGRAAQLVPLAIPTGNEQLDRQLARVLVKAAWSDEARLRAIEGALLSAGRPLRDLALLCRVRQIDLNEGVGSIKPISKRVVLRVADEARALGEGELADELLASIERQGVYR